MSTTYTPNANNNPATITLPSDLDDLTAEAFNAAYRALGDKSAFAIATRAALAAINTFTHGQIVEPTDEGEALVTSTRFPGKNTSGNRWALIFKLNIETNRSIRLHTGAVGGIGRFALTMNAKWNIGEQQWELEDDAGQGAALLWTATEMTLHNVPIGTTPFANWPTFGGTSDAGSLRAVGEFRYAATKTRTRTIPLATVSGAYAINGGNGSVGVLTLDDHSHIRWPIRIPPGAVLQKISIILVVASSAVETFKLTRRRPVWDEGSVTTPAESYLFTVDADSGVGTKIVTMITSGTAVDRYDDLTLLWVPSGTLLNAVHGITIEWADQGPTPI